jgi:allantoicase
MESIYEYGARAGFWRLHRLFTRHAIPVTVYGVATALARSPAQLQAMREAGWEIASHGLKWIDYRDVAPEAERADMEAAIRLHEQVTGERPLGWYTGRCSAATVDLATEEGGFLYLADSYADDLPYWREHKGRQQLIVPYTLDANDMRFATPQGFNAGDQFFTYLKDSFDVLYAEGEAGSPKMLSIGLHCRLAGRPGRIRALERFIEHCARHEKVWFARRIDIARHWHERHPPKPPAERPSTMTKERFVDRFGGVFEHSPWVAERAHALELGPAHDTAIGLWSAMARVFRAASDAERLAVLRAHPDLAGKLAQAKRLTAESTAEQASAGLDALTDDERARFTTLNERYVERFGFPFIIAVKGHTKAGILESFERRIGQEPESELETASSEVETIAKLRLADLLPAEPGLFEDRPMSNDDTPPPRFTETGINLASAGLGARALSATNEFFAPLARMLDDPPAVFYPDRYDDHGKWMDGWETIRRRNGGHDYAVIALAAPGHILGFDVDTAHFTGNYPPACRIEACRLESGDPDSDTVWHEILPMQPLGPSAHHFFACADERVWSHVRLHIYPDGGVARFRVYGRPELDPGTAGEIDLASSLNGARIVAFSNAHYGAYRRMLSPGRGPQHGRWLETRRGASPAMTGSSCPGCSRGDHQGGARHGPLQGELPRSASIQAADLSDFKGDLDDAVTTSSMFWLISWTGGS